MISAPKATVLVADENVFFRRLAAYQLTKAGYHVVSAENSQQALEWLQNDQIKPDLLLLDLFLPDSGGLEMMAQIKALGYRLPVVLMSTSEEPIILQGLSQADLFLKKPFSGVQLLASVKSLLLCVQSVQRLDGLLSQIRL